MSEWISVKDRLPETLQSVLVALNGIRLGVGLGYIHGPDNEWMQDGYGGVAPLSFGQDVTHWMPLPEAPK